MRHQHHAWPLVIVTMLSLGLAACSSGTGDSTSGNTASSSAATATPAASATATRGAVACSGLATINATLATLLNANGNTTVGEVKTLQQKVATTLDAVESRVPSTSEGLVGQIRSANDQIAAKVAGHPDTAPIGQASDAVQNIKTNAASAEAKATLLATALKCPKQATPMPTP